MRNWWTSLVKAIDEKPLQDLESQLTAVFFIIVCVGKTFKMYQYLSNEAILSLLRMITLYPESDQKSCHTYNFIRDHLLDKIQR